MKQFITKLTRTALLAAFAATPFVADAAAPDALWVVGNINGQNWSTANNLIETTRATASDGATTFSFTVNGTIYGGAIGFKDNDDKSNLKETNHFYGRAGKDGESDGDMDNTGRNYIGLNTNNNYATGWKVGNDASGTYSVVFPADDSTPFLIKGEYTPSEPEKPVKYTGVVPDDLYIIGGITNGDWGPTNIKGVQYTTKTTGTDGSVTYRFEGINVTGAFAFMSEIGINEKTPGKFWGNNTFTEDTPASAGKNYMIFRPEGDTAEGTTWKAWTLSGDYDITVVFPKAEDGEGFTQPYFYYTKVGVAYWLIGDMNHWMKEDLKSYSQYPTESYMTPEWKFVKSTSAKFPAADGWYQLVLPTEGQLLWGQFQIIDGQWDWDTDFGHTWSSSFDASFGGTCTTYENFDNLVDAERKKADSKYINDHALRAYDEYISETETFGIYTPGHAIKGGNGGAHYTKYALNMHLAHNAYKGATIYFNPGIGDELDGKVAIDGTPQDYYLFYGIGNDVLGNTNRGDLTITAKINNGQPNEQNYWLSKAPGHLYHEDGANLTFNSLGEITDHENLKEILLNANTYEKDGKLYFPNGMKIQDCYYVKIPNGFEDPAGNEPFTISITAGTKSGFDSDKAIMLRKDHIYIFDGIRIHSQLYDLKSKNAAGFWGDNPTIRYRVYGMDQNYSINVLTNYKNDRMTTVQANDTLTGWINLDVQHDCSNYEDVIEDNRAGEWKVSDYTNLWEPTQGAAAEGATDGDIRYQIASEHSNSYIQYEITRDISTADADYADMPEKLLYPSEFSFENESLMDISRPQGRNVYLTDEAITTAVKSIYTDFDFASKDAEPVYYNLQGVRVANPEKGIYIRVRGSKTDKVMF